MKPVKKLGQSDISLNFIFNFEHYFFIFNINLPHISVPIVLIIAGRWKKHDLKKHIHFNTVVRNCTYNEFHDDFTVVVENLEDKKVMPAERFDYLMVAGGHYSVPFVPLYPGVDRFPGRVMHSHDFRDACEFADKRLVIVSTKFYF